MKRPACKKPAAQEPSLKSRCTSLSQSLRLAGSQLSWATLANLVPDVLSVCRDDRDNVQAKLVDVIGGGMDTLEAQLQAALGDAEGDLAMAVEKTDTLAAAFEQAKAAAEAAAEDVRAKKTILKEGNVTLQAARGKLVEATASQASAVDDVEAAASKAHRLCEFKVAVLGPLKTDSLDKKAKASALRSFRTLGDFQLDPAILEAAPMALAKLPSERGSFDNMVVQHLEDNIEDALAKVRAVSEAGADTKEKRKMAVEEAEQAKSAAAETVKEAVAALADAESEEKRLQQQVKSAKAAVKDATPNVAKATKGVETAKLRLDRFMSSTKPNFMYLASWSKAGPAMREPDVAPDESAPTAASAGTTKPASSSEAALGPVAGGSA